MRAGGFSLAVGLLACSLTSSAETRGTFFYLSPESSFPSGQANVKDLERFSLKAHTRVQFLGERGGIRFWVSPDEVARDLDVSFRVLNPRTRDNLWIMSMEHGIAEAYNETTGERAPADTDELVPLTDDLGVAIPLIETNLRNEPAWKSMTITRVEARERLRILGVRDQWVNVSPLRAPALRGWTPITSLVTKFDFATHALPQKGKWQPVRYRKGSVLVTTDGSEIPLESVRALITNAEQGVALKPLAHLDLPARGHVQLLKPAARDWVESVLPDHGRVFWKRGTEDLAVGELKRDFLLSSESMLKRQIQSAAFHPKQPRIGLISAEGIFLTQDGFVWEKLPSFERSDYPVAISARGELFVGPYRSQDMGKTFQPYLKWESISAYNPPGYRHHPILRLLKIEPLDDGARVRLSLDNGLRSWKLVGDARYGLVNQWRVDY